jgi:hypothetical protein
MSGALTTAVNGWAHLYNNNNAVSTAVTYVHFTGMLVGGGFALVADRDAFRLSPEALGAAPFARQNFAEVHRWVVGGLAAVCASGMLMLLADLDTYLTSVAFWIKMGLVVLLLANGYGRVRAEARLETGSGAAWTWLRRTSVLSFVLWLAVLLASIILDS